MNAVCEVCGAIGFERLLLCCSDCKGGHTHQYCLAEVLFDANLEEWFCCECNQRHNEGSHSRSLEKVSSERSSNHAQFDSTSHLPITKRLESYTVEGPWEQQKSKSTVIGANLKKKHSSRSKSLQNMCIRNKSPMRGKDINRRGIRSKRSLDLSEQSNLSTGQVGLASSSKVVKQHAPAIVDALGYALGGTDQSHVLIPSEGLAWKSFETPQSLAAAQVYSTSSLEIPSKAKFARATEVEISDTVQNLRKDSPKKRRRLILTGDDEDEEEKAEDVQQENVNHQPLKCSEPMVKHPINTEYHVEEAIQTGDINDQNLINCCPMKRRRYIAENGDEDEGDNQGAESALNNASKWSSNDSAKMASQTPVAADHSLQSNSSDSEYSDRQYHICLQPLDEPVWSGVFTIDNKEFLKLDAHLSKKACQRVHELSGLLQPVVEVRMLSRSQAWPKRWISSGPTEDSIGLFFLPHSSTQNEDLTRLDRIIKSDDALQVTVGIAELLIFPSVLLPEEYHLFQGEHYLWGLFRQRKDILDNGVQVEEQDVSAHVTGEGQHQEHNLLVQQDEALYEISDTETFAAKHVVDAEDQLQVDGDLEVQNDTMKVATSEGITSLSSRYCLKKVLYNAPKEGWCCDECNRAPFESTSQQPITIGINFTAPAPPQSPATGITQDLGPTGRKALASIRFQDFHSACSPKADTGVDVCLPSDVQSKVITHNHPAPEHDLATFNFQKVLPVLEKDLVAMTEKATQGQVDKISLLRSQLQEKKVLAPLRERMVSVDAEHESMKIQSETLKSQAKEIPELRSDIGSLDQEKNDLQVENSTEKTQCQALQIQVEEIPGLISQVKDLGKVRTALSNEKAGLEAELKSARSELEKCQTEVKSLRERIRTLEEKKVAWPSSEERDKAATTAFEVEGDKVIQDKSAQDSEIKSFHDDLEKAKSQVGSYKSQLEAAKLEKKAAVQNLKTSKVKAKCHLIDTLTSCSAYLLALVQSANPDFDPSSIDWTFRVQDPDTEALIDRNMGIVWRFVQKFVRDAGVGQRSLSRKRFRKLNTRIAGPEWKK